MTKLLEKVKKIITEAKENDIDLVFDFNIENELSNSYQDIINVKNSLNVLKVKVKDLEKDFLTKKANKSVSDLSAFLDTKIEIDGVSTVVAITSDYEVSVLKQIVDAICNRFEKYFVLLANINNTNVNFICKSNYEKVNCGMIIKELSLKSNGNGGGNASFAQGGGTNIDNLSANLQEIKDYLRNA